jgi:hypothetical protein
MLSPNTKLINTYYMYIKNLDPEIQMNLVKKITHSLKTRINKPYPSIRHLFGAWQGEETAHQLISHIRKSREFNRKIDLKIITEII